MKTWAAALLVLVAGALLRLITLGDQSLWLDEGLTRALVIQPFGDMVEGVADTENTPPLFYVLTHIVTQVAGTGEAGLRLLSALCGVATIAVAYLAGREIDGDRAGLAAGALVAVNPFLVWFSQEARSYALLSLLTAIGLLCFLRAVRVQSGWALAGWAVASAAAVVTHYFAIFPVAAEAAWLLWSVRAAPARRPVLIAVGSVLAAVTAIAPMAISQEGSGRAESISREDLGPRIAQVPKQFLVGYDGPLQAPLTVVSAVLLLVAAVGLWRIRHRREVAAVALVVIAAVLVPIAAAVAGADFLYSRNTLAGLVPVLVLAGVGFAALPWPRLAAAAVAGLVAIGLVTVIGVDRNPHYQRADWRSLSDAVGRVAGSTLLIVSPGKAEVPLAAYRGGIATAPGSGTEVTEIILAGVAVNSSAGGSAAPPRPPMPPPPSPGFALVESELERSYTLFRYRAPKPTFVRPALLAPTRLNPSYSVLLLRGQEP